MHTFQHSNRNHDLNLKIASLNQIGLKQTFSSFRDAGAWEHGNTHWGRVETPQNFGVFWGTGGIGVHNIGGSVSKIIKK